MKIGDRLIGECGALRISLEVHEEDIAVTLRDKAGKVLGTEQAPIDNAFAQAKERAVLLIARQLNAHSEKGWDRIRKDISWKPEA